MTPTPVALAAYANLIAHKIKRHNPDHDVAADLAELFKTQVIPSPRRQPTRLMVPGHATLHLVHGTWIGQPTTASLRPAEYGRGE